MTTTYKQTNLVSIPNEWETKKLEEIGEIFRGKGLSKSKISNDGKYPCILYGELFTTYDERVSEIKSYTNCNEGALSKKGDVLLPGSTTTTGVDLADASAVLLDNVLLGGDINIIRDKDNNFDGVFLAYLLTNRYCEQIGQIAKGITVWHLHGTDLLNMEITIPKCKAEQEAIAGVLSDMDTLLAALDKLIAKKKQIKTGAMQKLLAPQKDWETKKLEEICNFLNGPAIPAKSRTYGNYPFYGANGVVDYVADYIFDGTFLLVGSRGSVINPDGTPVVNLVRGKFYAGSNTVHILQVKNKAESFSSLLFYLLSQSDFSDLVGIGSIPMLLGSTLKKFEICLPKSIAEQEAIAGVLSDMDAEIAALERKREKYRQIKAGAMQQLLTGKVRLLSTNQ